MKMQLWMAGLIMSTVAFAQTQGSLPARAAPSEYQVQAKIGDLTIAADFVSHSVPTMEGPLTSEDHVAVEVAFFGPPEAKTQLSWEHFSLRINGKKTPTPAVPIGMAMKGLKDPEWVPPEPPEGSKSKGGISGGGGGAAPGEPKPEPPKMPLPLRRAMEQRARKSAMAEGERPLPQAGLIFFPYRGKDGNIEKVELLYEGPAGKATLPFER
jgi:hypothetical protein